MVMKSGERWHCANAACRCSLLVETSGEIEGRNPRCTCGGVMKKVFSPPVFRRLDFPQLAEPEFVLRHSAEE